MLKSKKGLLALSAMVMLTGCANYEAQQLSMISGQTSLKSQQNPSVTVGWKTFDKEDCKTYLGRDVIAEGYIPVQVTIQNKSDDAFYLNPNNFSVSIPSASEVANKVHTSTAGRVAAWGIPGLIVAPLLIPAICDGIKSSEANRSLDADYQEKSVKERTINAFESFNGIIFVPKKEADKDLCMILVNTRTGERLSFQKD